MEHTHTHITALCLLSLLHMSALSSSPPPPPLPYLSTLPPQNVTYILNTNPCVFFAEEKEIPPKLRPLTAAAFVITD